MSGLDPTGPAQPSLDQSYQTRGNPSQKEPTEQYASELNARAPAVGEQRIPTNQSSSIEDATPSSLGYGVHGAPPGEEARGFSAADVDRSRELEGEQMRAPGEKDIYEAVDRKPGAGGQQHDFASDLDRKKAQQAPLRDAKIQERERNVDVSGILSDRPGPANPVDRNNYPNTGT